MRALLDLFLDICLLRKGPQHLPPSSILLKLALVAYGLSGLLLLLVSVALPTALLLTLLDLGLLAGLTYGVLYGFGYGMRFVRTLAALAGSGTLLQLIALPLSVWLNQEAARHELSGLPSLLWLALLGWSIAIMTHILHHALSVSRGVALWYALGYLAISWTLSGWLHPVD